jgi:hypothetical protein
MTDPLDVARELLPSYRLDRATALQAGDRSSVWRVRAVDGDRNTGTVIVKHFHTAGESWVREVAALTTLPSSLHAPRVLASSAEPPVVVMTDAGDGASLADALLGDDAAYAGAALNRWAEAMARLHVATRDLREPFKAALDERAGDLPVWDHRMGADIDDAMRVIDLSCASLGVNVPGGALDEVRDLIERLGSDGAAAITPADACPDDNVLTDDELVIVDFENAQWRNIAWDVAYLRAPWPTCWCAWQLPDEVADSAVAAYRAIAGEAFEKVASDDFDRDVDAASVGWTLVSTSWLLNAVSDADASLSGRAARGPKRRAMVLGRLERAARSTELPTAAQLAERLGETLREQWGDVPLDLAPAFR